MASPISTILSLLSLIFFVYSSSLTRAASTIDDEAFLHCLSSMFLLATHLSAVVYSQNSSSYDSILQFSAQNPYLLTPSTPNRPLYIITPVNEAQIQASVVCSKQHGLQIRVRSGGHDYEGLSYVATEPFLILDLIKYRAIDINVKDRTAWVQAGATLGELYYSLANTSSDETLGFPAGVCSTMGVGGHFSGGGIGLSMRKHGLSIDNIIDAIIVDVNGDLLDRESMGKDLFWAIRGGGAASFGVVLSWKIRLVQVPSTVTVFSVSRTLEEGATRLMRIWQNVAPQLPDELVIRVILQAATGIRGTNSTVHAIFNTLYLGSAHDLLSVMKLKFPELGLRAEDCQQMSWVDSTLYFDGFPSGTPREALLNRTKSGRSSFRGTSDYVTEPIPEEGLRGIWEKLLEEPNGLMILEPLGGKINAVSENETPFPYRGGKYLYIIQHYVHWDSGAIAQRYLDWIRRLYGFLTPYVSHSPRGAYVNYKDLDLGKNDGPNTSYETASAWGFKYFKGNFRKLALVKGRVDPENYFRNDQSISPLLA